MKKIISVILAVVICLSVFLVAVNAQDNSPCFEVVGTTAVPEKIIPVKIRINNNPGITALQINVEYSTDDLVLLECVDEGLFDNSISTSKTTNNPFTISWYSSSSADSSASGDFVTLNFTEKAGAKSSEIKITYDEENIFNSKFENQTFSIKNGTVEINKIEPTTQPATTPTTVPTTSPQLVLQSVTGAANDTVDVSLSVKNNPSITALRVAVEYSMDDLELLEITDGGLFDESITHSKELSSPVSISWYSQKSVDCKNNGTLAVLKFRIKENAKSSDIKLTYDKEDIFNVNFDNVGFDVVNGRVDLKESSHLMGDANLDGTVNIKDVTLIQQHIASICDFSDEQMLVANVNSDNRVDILDATMIQKYLALYITSLE